MYIVYNLFYHTNINWYTSMHLSSWVENREASNPAGDAAKSQALHSTLACYTKNKNMGYNNMS